MSNKPATMLNFGKCLDYATKITPRVAEPTPYQYMSKALENRILLPSVSTLLSPIVV